MKKEGSTFPAKQNHHFCHHQNSFSENISTSKIRTCFGLVVAMFYVDSENVKDINYQFTTTLSLTLSGISLLNAFPRIAMIRAPLNS